MNTAEDFVFDGEVIDRTREVVGDGMAAVRMAFIAWLAETMVEQRSLGRDCDDEDLHELAQRAYRGGDLPGFPTGEGDRVKGYSLNDVRDAMATSRYRQLLVAEEARADKASRAKRREERARRDEQARLEAHVAGERKLVPHLYALLEELQAEVAALRSERRDRGNARHPS